MRNATTIFIRNGKGFKNKLANLMHELGMFKVVYVMPVPTGTIITAKGSGSVRFILNALFRKRVARFDTFVIE